MVPMISASYSDYGIPYSDSENDDVDVDVDVELKLFDINKSVCSNKRLLCQLLASNICLSDETHTRKPRIARDRNGAWAFVQTFSDDLFKRHFRVTRTTFNEIVSRMMFCFDSCSFL